MTTQDIAAMMEELSIPTAYYQFKDTNVAPPFAVFYYPGRFDLIADDRNYVKIPELVIELCTDNKDFALEAEVEQLLADHGLVYDRDEEWNSSEKMYVITYSTSFVLTEE